MAQIIRNLPAMWEIQARSLDEEDALEEKIVTHCSILAWRTHSRGTWRAAVHGVTDSDMAEWLILSFWATNTSCPFLATPRRASHFRKIEAFSRWKCPWRLSHLPFCSTDGNPVTWGAFVGLTELCRISPAGAQHLQALSKAGEFQSQTCKMSDLRVAASESAVPQGALLKKCVSISQHLC